MEEVEEVKVKEEQIKIEVFKRKSDYHDWYTAEINTGGKDIKEIQDSYTDVEAALRNRVRQVALAVRLLNEDKFDPNAYELAKKSVLKLLAYIYALEAYFKRDSED